VIVLFAPDSFKGTLTSVQVARALADGWLRARPDDEILLCPLADGGEGTLEAVAAAGGWTWQTADVLGMDFDRCQAPWLRSMDGSRAVIELAKASGLSLVNPATGDVMIRATWGTGEVLLDVLDSGARDITLGIGGSATNDGGTGLLEALGTTITRRDDGSPLISEGTPTPPLFVGVDPVRADLSHLDPRLAEVDLQVACDVSNPLLGPTGATETYGPQKGATRKDRQVLEYALEAWADALEAATGRRERNTPGAGAAGGVGFALLAIQDRFGSFALRPGVDLVMEATDFEGRLARADLVITGEGRIDAQTAFGKTALGVARRARAAARPCIGVGGGVEPEGVEALAAIGARAVPVWESPVSLEVALAAGPAPLEACGERLARAWAAADTRPTA
jgi:glycerate kinase